MQKDHLYQTTTQEIRQYTIPPTIITSSSPRNIMIQNNYPLPASVNYAYSIQSNHVNP